MVKSPTIFLEGGGVSKDLQITCRKGIRKLLENCGYIGRLPRIKTCGSRNDAFDDFKTQYKYSEDAYIALLVDSEHPVKDIDKTWDHLSERDGWDRPDDAADDQVLLMTTCMETWIAADPTALQNYFDPKNKKLIDLRGLPKTNLESRDRHSVLDCLKHATRNCKTVYAKGKTSFEVIGKVSPDILKEHLPSFKRMLSILDNKL